MKTASVKEIQTELKSLPSKELIQLCMRLAKYKKENKEYLSYLLFESIDESNFVNGAKLEVDQLFEEINTSSTYYIKKSLRKILRLINKYIKFSENKQTEVELRLYFCRLLNESTIDISRSLMLTNIYTREVEKIKKAISKLHEDLQFDFKEEIEDL